ncbi:MAG TPA: AMP-binding protein, partial [Polyangiaceae bacterium]
MDPRPKVISKRTGAAQVASYDGARTSFSWSQARGLLDGLPDGRGLNIAHEAVTRHAKGARRDHVALVWLGRNGATRTLTYAELERESNRFANVLAAEGVGQGESVFVLAGRIPALYVAVLGTLKKGCVLSPLFSAFGPEPI